MLERVLDFLNIDDLGTFWMSAMVSSTRMLSVFTMLPFLSQEILTRVGRLGITLSFSLIVAPLVFQQMVGVPMYMFPLIIVKEVFLGLSVGYVMACVFWAFEAAGNIIDNQRGASSASTFNPISGSGDSTIMGVFMLNTAVWLLMASGGFGLMIMTLLMSYALWPVSTFWPSISNKQYIDMQGVDFFLGNVSGLMVKAVLFAAPAMLAMFLCEMLLALLNRFAPQLQVFFLAMPVKSAVAVFFVMLYGQYLLVYFSVNIEQILTAFEDLAQVIS